MLREIWKYTKAAIGHIDPILFACTTLLSLISIITIISAVDNFGKSKLVMQVAMFVVGNIIMLIVANLDYHIILDRLFWFMLIFSAAILAVTLVAGTIIVVILDNRNPVKTLAWIMVLEQGLSLQKDIVYGAALLHDLGRYRQYEDGTPHHQASAALAETILPDAGYTADETAMIAAAIGQHGAAADAQGQLARILYDADKLSRNCFQCSAQAECKWLPEKRNTTILY